MAEGPVPEGLDRLRAVIERALATGEILAPASLAERFGLPVAEVRRILADVEGRGTRRHIGRYEVLEEIGQGAQGVVYRARDPQLHRVVALKVLSPQLSTNERAIARFQREASAAARITHPNLLPIHEIGEHDGSWYFAMELVEGPNLQERIQRKRQEGATSLPDEGREVLVGFLLRLIDVGEALHLAHEAGILHRDIKPSNILVAEDGTLKLVDFGLAREVGQQHVTLPGAALGTPMYMSPQQFSGHLDELDRRTDVYSLGMTLYEALTLRAPYRASSLGELAECVLRRDPPSPRSLGLRFPTEMEAIVFKAVEKDPLRRYPTAAAFTEDLRNFVEYRPVAARPQGRLVRLRKRLQRDRRIVKAVGVTLATVALATFAVLGWPLLERGIAAWNAAREREDREQRAAETYAWIRERTPQEAIPLSRRWLEDFPHAALRTEVQLGLAEDLMAAQEREAARAVWAEVWLERPGDSAGTDAVLRLARSLLDVGATRRAAIAAGAALSAETPAHRTQALLLSAEAALGQGDYRRGAGYLEALEEECARLAVEPPRRLAALRVALREFLPPRDLRILPHRTVTGGRFRRDERNLLAATAESAFLYRWKGNGLERIREVVEVDGRSSYSHAAIDVDGDGIDEFLYVTSTRPDPSEGGDVPEELRILDLTGPESVVRFRARVPVGSYKITVADFDHDGMRDLLLAASYPVRGVVLFRGSGDFAFASLGETVLGDMSRIHGEESELSTTPYGDVFFHMLDPYSDIRRIVVADLEGDRRPELVMAADQHRLFSLLVYEWDRGQGAFRERARRRVGSVQDLLVRDLNADGRDDVGFALTPTLTASARDLCAEFLPQGIHYLHWDDAQGAFDVSPVEGHRRLRFAAGAPECAEPTNQGFSSLAAARRGGGSLYLVGEQSHWRGSALEGASLKVWPVAAPGEAGFLLGPNVHVRPMCVYDIDGDGRDDILRTGGDRIQVCGLGGELRPVTPAQRPARGPTLTGLDLQFDIAQRLQKLELYDQAERAYRELQDRADVAGTPQEERALLGRVSARGFQERYDECLGLLERWVAEHAEVSPGLYLLRAHYLERTWRLEDAARQYAAMGDEGALPHVERDQARAHAERLAPWLDLREVPLSAPEAWSVTEPGHHRVRPDETLEIRDTSGRRTTAWLPVPLPGGSFRLEFELRLDRLDGGQNLSLGWFVPGSEGDLDPCLIAPFSHTSGGGRSAGVRYSHGPAHFGRSTVTPGGGMPLGVWHRVRATYEAGHRLLGVRIADEQDRLLCNFRIEHVPWHGAAGMRLALLIGHGAFSGEHHSLVRGLRLWEPAASPRAADLAPRSPSIYEQAATRLMLGREEDARDLCRQAVEAGNESQELAWLTAVLTWRATRDPEALDPLRAGGDEAVRWLEGRVFLMTPEEQRELVGAPR